MNGKRCVLVGRKEASYIWDSWTVDALTKNYIESGREFICSNGHIETITSMNGFNLTTNKEVECNGFKI